LVEPARTGASAPVRRSACLTATWGLLPCWVLASGESVPRPDKEGA
jgi:sulfite exporter TauE/SafE